MNIDVSNLLSLFSSVGGLDNLIQTESAEVDSVEEFSDAFTAQIALLQDQRQLSENKETSDAIQDPVATIETEPLQEFAGLLNDYGKMAVSPAKKGQNLPLAAGHIEKDINVDKTIDTLQNVMQHIAAVTDFVEEKAAEVTDVIEKVVEFLQADTDNSNSQDQSATHQQLLEPFVASESEIHNDLEKPDILADDSLFDELSKEDAARIIEPTSPISQNEFIIPAVHPVTHSVAAELPVKPLEQSMPAEVSKPEETHLFEKQKHFQHVFGKDYEKSASVNLASNPTQTFITRDEQIVDSVSSFDPNFMDDILNKEQAKSSAFSDLSSLEKPKEASFDLSALNSISGAEKPVTTNNASELALLNRQVANSSPIKGELTAMTKPFEHSEWQKEFNERIVWMNNKSISAAEIRLNPQHLGPVSIRIDVNQDQANIAFTAQHGVVREAIEAAIPKLREMLSGQQLNLAEVNVAGQDFSDQRPASQGFFQGGQKQDSQFKNEFSLAENSSEVHPNTVDLTEEIEQGRATASNGLLNTYA